MKALGAPLHFSVSPSWAATAALVQVRSAGGGGSRQRHSIPRHRHCIALQQSKLRTEKTAVDQCFLLASGTS